VTLGLLLTRIQQVDLPLLCLLLAGHFSVGPMAAAAVIQLPVTLKPNLSCSAGPQLVHLGASTRSSGTCTALRGCL
jgi:hypothetical protein